jgi:hypothetical protein
MARRKNTTPAQIINHLRRADIVFPLPWGEDLGEVIRGALLLGSLPPAQRGNDRGCGRTTAPKVTAGA